MRRRLVPILDGLSTRWREAVLITIGIIALLGGVFAAFDLVHALKNGEAVYSVSVSGLSIEGELQGYTQESRRVLLYALTTSDPNLQLPHVKAARQVDAEVARLHREFAKIPLSPSAKTLLESLCDSWGRYVNVRNEIIGLILEDRTGDALSLEQTQASPLFDVCASRLRELKVILDQFAKKQLVEIRRTYYRCAAEVGFLSLTMLLLIGSLRMLTALRRKNQHLGEAEILERHRSRILEAINQNTPLAEIFSDIASLVERRVPIGLAARIYPKQGRVLEVEDNPGHFPDGVRILSVSIVDNSGGTAATLDLHSPKNISLRDDDLRFCERAGQLASLAIEHHRVTGELAFQAEHDELTGLANRAKCQESLHRAVCGSSDFGLLWIDLDRFKQVNDMFGHHVGDCLLQQVAQRLTSCVSSSDTVARIGGDEFVILLSRCGDADAAAEIASQVLEQLNRPVSALGRELSVSASIGVSLYPEHGEDPETLLRNADTAMYSAKVQGKNMFQIYDANMGTRSSENLEISRELRTALNDGQFEIHYQPQCAPDGTINGAEALLRWRNPTLGLVSPARFIPIAEENGVIIPLGAWVLRQACVQAARWHREGHPTFRIAVNVSAHQFVRSDFASTVASALSESGIDPRCLELELTESTVMQDLEKTVRQMNTLRALGISIAVDDFGTGASSLSYLTQLPIDALKIDRSFITSIDAHTRNTLPLIRAIIGMASGLRLKLVAEGVETLNQLRVLEMEGCDLFQGYYFHKPLTAAKLTVLLDWRGTSCVDHFSAASALFRADLAEVSQLYS